VLTKVDRLPVVFTQYNDKGDVIMREERVIALSSIMASAYAYCIIKPDAAVRMTVDIVFPFRS
jgi:hypothetical protein